MQVSISSGVEGLLGRSEEHTSELQSLTNLVCRLLLEKKKKKKNYKKSLIMDESRNTNNQALRVSDQCLHARQRDLPAEGLEEHVRTVTIHTIHDARMP